MKRRLCTLLLWTLCFALLVQPCAAEGSGVAQNTDYVRGDWHVDAPENHGVDPETLEAFYAAIAKEPLLTVLIIKDGSIISQYAKEGYLADGMFSMNSCTKSVTGALVGIAIDRGLIGGVDTKLTDFFPELLQDADAAKRDITLEHLLTMTSGLYWPEWTAWQLGFGNWLWAENEVNFVLEREMNSVPGKVFNYNTGGVHLLSAIVQKTSGRSTAAFARENLFDPLGMGPVDWYEDKQGIAFGGFSIGMTPKDAARLGQLYLNKGMWGDRRIFSESWAEDSTRAHNNGSHYFSSYGYLWWVSTHDGHALYYAMGSGGQYIIVVPDAQLVCVLTGEYDGRETARPMHFFRRYIVDKLW